MQIRLQFIPKLSLICSGVFIAVLVLSSLIIPAAQNNNQNFSENYGNALASMAAKQAVDAAFNHDLVRLQVILQDVMENPHTIVATIHDVENNLLVQAGDARLAQSSEHSYSSPIVLHDSIAGYVSVSIDDQPWSLRSASVLLSAIGLFSLVLGVWSLFHQKAIAWSPATEKNQETPKNNVAPDEQIETNSISEVATPQFHESVFAVIHIKNLTVLKQQLNGQNFRDTIGRLEKILEDVMALYGGHQKELIDNYYVLQFHSERDKGEALFNATCSAFLTMELAGIIDKIPLDLAALVSANQEEIVPERLPFAGLILESGAGTEPLIERRIEFMELGTEDGRRVLAGFRQPFQNLLENQRQQLSQIL